MLHPILQSIEHYMYIDFDLFTLKDPMLFGGSMRRNLDPMTRFPDAKLWKSLAEVGLKNKVEKLPGKKLWIYHKYDMSFLIYCPKCNSSKNNLE